MALYRQGKAAMDANGIVTGTGTNWQSALTLIRPGATILFLSSPIQMAVVNKVVSDTQINAITTNGAIVPSSDYAILLSDSLTVDGLAQDVAETLRYYQSQETEIADAVDFFKSFDFEALQSLADQVRADSEAASESAAAAAVSESKAKTSETNAKVSENAAKTSEVAAETARDQVQQIINDAGDQSTLVVLASDDPGNGVSRVYGALKQVSLTNFLSLADLMRFDNKELVNFDNAIAEAKLAGLERVYLPNGHFGIADTTSFANILIVGSNKSQFGDIKLENSDGSSGKLSLETEGTVLHITGNAAATGITLSNSGSGFTSSLCGIIGCSIYYPDQDWKDWTQGTTADIDGDYYYEPTVYPPTFVADVAMRVVFDNLFFINAYHWIDIKNAQLVTFGKIAGSLLNRGYTVTRMAAGGVTENFNSYPFWTWACGFAGISQRVNHYCDAVGKAIQVGLDDGVTRTVEQMRILHAAIIGCADGIICGGKGVSIVDAKIDNVMRGITISEDDNSAYHQIGKAWVSSYYRNNYVPKQRKDDNVYGFKSNTSTPIDLSGLQVVRADGRGVWMPYSSGSQVKGAIVQQCMYKAFEFGSRGRTTDVISVNGCYAGMYVDTSLTDQVAYTFGDFMRCDIKGLQWKGASNVTPYVLNNDLNYYEAGKELDLTSLGGRFYKGYSNTLFTQERGLRGFINGLGASSTAAVETLRLSGTNTGAKMLNTGLGIRNTVSDGTGYGALVLYASLAGADTPIVEVYGDGANTGLRPLTDASRDLGDATYRFRRGYFSESVAVGGNPVGVKVAVPASATAPGSVGQWAADSAYLYVCIAANTWVRSALTTW